MPSVRVQHIVCSVLFAAVTAVPTGCSAPLKPADTSTPVPERTSRLEYDLDEDRRRAPGDEQAPDVIAEAIDDTVCLLRSERAEECKEPDPDPPLCTVRSEQEIREAIEPTFRALPQIQLTSPARISRDVVPNIPDPDAIVTYQVSDARRDNPCRDWRAEQACVAVKVDKIWILLHAPQGGGPVNEFEVFLAERVCEESPQ